MNRRKSLQLLSAGASLSLAGPSDARTTDLSSKKGWAGGKAEYHKQFGANWHYNWTPNGRNTGNCPFIPMIKGKSNLAALQKISQKKDLTHLLGYNEPDRKKQANLTVEEGVKLWPQLVKIAEQRGIPLGSPAPTSDTPGLKWLAEFMKQADKEKLRVDFIAIHYYGGTDPENLEKFIDRIARQYRLPIWLTEWNGWAGTEQEHYDFVKKSLHFLERSSDIERYAYFNPKAGSAHSLLNPDGTRTRIGELYRDAGR